MNRAVLFLSIYPREKEEEIVIIKKTHIDAHSNFIYNSQNWKQCKCPSTGEQIKNCDIFTQCNILSNDKELPLHTIIWINLLFKLSKISYFKRVHSVGFYLYEVLQPAKLVNLQWQEADQWLPGARKGVNHRDTRELSGTIEYSVGVVVTWEFVKNSQNYILKKSVFYCT